MLSLLRLERQENVFLESTSSLHITLSFLFIWNQTTNTFIMHSLENHTRIQTKIDKVYTSYTRFQTKTAQNPYPLGRHTPINKYKGVPPPPGV